MIPARRFKQLCLHAAKWSGCFLLARLLTRRGLRVLAYHGHVLDDEHHFRPGLFIEADVFRRRMEYLVKKRYPVISLDEAVEHLRNNTVPPGATVVTFDDGFYSTWMLAVPVMRDLRLPATIYVTTYYCVKRTPVFRLAVQYMFWRTEKSEAQLDDLGPGLPAKVSLAEADDKERATWALIRFGEHELDESQRTDLCRKLGERLGIDYGQVAESRRLSLMNEEDVAAASRQGIDIQLHTHRHHLPREHDGARRELAENRALLERLAGGRRRHFCYPSGIHFKEHHPPLVEQEIASAVTCDQGLNYPQTPPLALRRFLDASDVSFIEFEAEITGFAHLARFLGAKAGRFLGARRTGSPLAVNGASGTALSVKAG
jgi:peptidoglycan/xylan/chitin deacetylase (PgdA/CDA1 family)